MLWRFRDGIHNTLRTSKSLSLSNGMRLARAALVPPLMPLACPRAAYTGGWPWLMMFDGLSNARNQV
jgi:hypothetical protein